MKKRNLFFPNRRNTDKELEVDARHWAAENGEVFFVEEVVDCPFDREVCPFEIAMFRQYDIAHKIGWEFSGE